MGADRTGIHLTDAELFGLALPPAGEPEALPAHLSECGACGRALQTWKSAVRELARDDAGPIGRRSPAQWRAAEEHTLGAIRRSRVRSRFPVRWAVGLAAALLVGALLLPLRRTSLDVPAGVSTDENDELSAADLADDTLLRDAALLASGETPGIWNPFAAEPGETPRAEDGRL
jgi:hypothetical protein